MEPLPTKMISRLRESPSLSSQTKADESCFACTKARRPISTENLFYAESRQANTSYLPGRMWKMMRGKIRIF